MVETPFISVIIPAFNEAPRIDPTLDKVVRYLDERHSSWEVVVVDDGSSDATATLVSQWSLTHDRVRLERIPHSGKGSAVRHGMLSATGTYRFMCDADLAMPIDWLEAFLDRMNEGYDVVIGSRQIAGARRFDEPLLRHMMGRFFNWSVRLLALGGIQDTQCGFKCFRGEVAQELFELQTIKGFAFDVEILYLAKSKQGLRVLELPVDWYHQKESKVRAGVDSLQMLRDTILVRWRDLRGQYGGLSSLPYTKRPAERPSRQGTAEVSSTTGPQQRPNGALAVVVPTYNEAANLPELADRVFALGLPDTRLIVVDDNSPDGTADVAEALAGKFDGRLEVLRRQSKQGLGTAYKEGFAKALAEGADYVVQMDGDLSHAPEYIPAFLEELNLADVVVGSRYVEGGGVDERWGLGRRLLSQVANWGIRLVSGLQTRDATSGFRAFKAATLQSIKLGELRCKGFGIQAELAHACQRQGYRLVEYPILFSDRTSGRSKMSLFIVLEALWYLLPSRWRR